MKVAFVTNFRAPYRILQFNEFNKISEIEFTAYYTHKEKENRKWESKKSNGYKEEYLKGINILKSDGGYINTGLISVVKKNDLIIVGGYEQPTYILISFLCKLYKKKFIISYDGISTDRLNNKESLIKKIVKKSVITKADYILGNGTVSKRYFNEVFGYPKERIYNQYLTVDTDMIDELYLDRELYRNQYRKKYNISEEKKVLIYSGRLVEVKNLKNVINALSKVKEKEKIVFLILGDGVLRNSLEKLAKEKKVQLIVTGFINEQRELFKHYFVGDAFILPSIYEPWGLVVNEAMCAGLAVLVSSICGCSLDLVKNNGYIINPQEEEDIAQKIKNLLFKENYILMGNESRNIIKEWNFKNSKNELLKIIEKLGMI